MTLVWMETNASESNALLRKYGTLGHDSVYSVPGPAATTVFAAKKNIPRAMPCPSPHARCMFIESTLLTFLYPKCRAIASSAPAIQRVCDVHINRAPIAGVIRRLVYLPGKFMNADLDKASEENERQHILVERADGTRIGFTQIAGLLARRIVPFVKPGDTVGAGQRVGLIRFGSRVDVYLPVGTDSKVLLGQRCIAGETVLGEIGTRKLIEGVSQ